ncbi:MAG: UDP-3-O-acyl-N-acetylglucosamine deacetylase, partial [Candidatus Omnitrophota bacterium]
MDRQSTIEKRVYIEGVGLHTGKKVKMEFMPLPVNTGILFVRKDLNPSVTIKASFYSVLNPEVYPRRTSVGEKGVYVHTIEHLMAALHLLGIDNIQINIWGEEIPGMDGSAKGFVEKLQEAAIITQDSPRHYFVIKEPFCVQENDSSIVAIPYPHTRISYTLKYDNPVISTGYFDLVLNGDISNRIYEARTFCLEEEVEPLIKMGLGKGSNYENTLVVSKKEVLENKVRFPDEFVKHKVLDLLGDLYLAGPIKGHIIALRSGHNL